ncbi:MAG TPA: Crp/Fnr family transcriptional regulator [Candidatus Methylomirabilis sp.]|nr:Crp/Fnr family transcriptional regulator [Candidatus Methylomirabilis sp.]
MSRVQDCATCRVREFAALCSGGETALAAFTRTCSRHVYQAKQTLFHENTPALGLYGVCTGRIKVSRVDDRGREQILRLVDPGGILGEECLLEDGLFLGTAWAMEESQVAFVGRRDVLQLLRVREGMSEKFVTHLCQMLQTAQTGLARATLTDARSRLAGLLLDLGRRYGLRTEEGITCSLNLSRAELGAMIGLTPETTMRLLSAFREEGMIRTDGRTLTLLQPDRLEALA